MPNDTDSVRGLVDQTNANPQPADLQSDQHATQAHPRAQNGAAGVEIEAAGSLLFEDNPDDFDFGFDEDPNEMEAMGNIEGGMVVLDDPDNKRRAAQARQRRMSRSERRRRVRLQARRVRRIVRHIEPWSVLKISLMFYACLWLIFLVSGFMVWGVLDESGTIENFETLITDFFVTDGEPFQLESDQMFRAYALIGLVLAIAGTTFNVLMVLLFNLLSDLTGGLRITMIEEETARPTPPKKRRRRRASRVPPPR